MNFIKGFSRKAVHSSIELEILHQQLQLLSLSILEGTDKPTDLRFWKKILDEIDDLDLDQTILRAIRDPYEILYWIYLQRHYPELYIEEAQKKR